MSERKTVRSAPERLWEASVFKLAGRYLGRLQRVRASQFVELGTAADAVVFLGDSISEGGLWSEWFPDCITLNRGIGGETTSQILNRLDSAIDRPRAVVLLAGTNDLSFGLTPHAVAARVVQIVDRIRLRSPDCAIFVQSVMPRQRKFATEIKELNSHVKRLLRDRSGVEFVDLWTVLSTPEDRLRPEFTEDSLHLNGAGYAAWVGVLKPLIEEIQTVSNPTPLAAKQNTSQR